MPQAISIPHQSGLSQGSAAPQTTHHPAPAGPLSAEHREQIAQAQQRYKKIKRAAQIASFNAWSFAVCAAFSLLFAILSPSALIAALVLVALAWNEFRGRRQLKRLDPLGANTLCINQVACCVAIAMYCILKLTAALSGQGPYTQAMAQTPEIAATLEPMQDLLKTATISAYALILIVGVAVQGLTAWYYYTRKRWVHAYREKTPSWIVELQSDRGRI